jgi:outer membrane protein OmpA-like peptidoglycan-associated protein
MRRLTKICLLAMMGIALHNTGAHAADAVPTQKVVIYFQEWSAAFDDSALASIAKAADYAKAHPRLPIHVAGFADPTGSKQANVLMSELRAQVVVDQLVTDGVPAGSIGQVGRGSVQFALTSQESRRVEISVGSR